MVCRILLCRSIPVLEIAQKSNRSHWSVRGALNNDVKYGLVKSKRKVLSNGYLYKFYILTEKGKKLINILRGVMKH